MRKSLYDISDDTLLTIKSKKKTHILEFYIDCEATGLNVLRDRLCSIQILIRYVPRDSSNSKKRSLDVSKKLETEKIFVHFPEKEFNKSKNLKELFLDKDIFKIFHYARQDLLYIKTFLDMDCKNVFCTKIMSRFARTYSEKHSLKELCRELLGLNIDKGLQSSYWGAATLTENQINYAMFDVLYLPDIFDKLNNMLKREKREKICYDFMKILPVIIQCDQLGFDPSKIINHHTVPSQIIG